MNECLKSNKPNTRVVYADIIDLPHWQSPVRAPMTAHERAAQFSSFKALDGYEDMVSEEAREVSVRETLSEYEMEILNAKILLIADEIEDGRHPVLKFTYFIDDIAKTGGSYVSITERVRKVDIVNRKIQLFKTVGLSKSYMELDMDKVKDISGDMVDYLE